jgi:putative RNA 2'-phosphotransferase
MLDNENIVKYSKELSYILRHRPEKYNIELDKQGYAKVTDILKILKINHFELDEVVDKNDKKRFAYSENKQLIRASQGHSVKGLKIDYKEIIPPLALYHGTANKVLDLIKFKGIKKMNREYVHLSPDIETATKVAQRHDKNIVILEIDTLTMIRDGFTFWISENNVYLTNDIPFHYIKIL